MSLIGVNSCNPSPEEDELDEEDDDLESKFWTWNTLLLMLLLLLLMISVRFVDGSKFWKKSNSKGSQYDEFIIRNSSRIKGGIMMKASG